jgi:dipeptidyl aminopeptidase/acylaminoacyl peptidase
MARLWNVETGELSTKSPRHDEQVESATFSPNGRLIATASQDRTARVWDVESGKPLGEPLRHEKGVAAVSFSPDCRRIVTASYDNTARVWETQTGKPVSEPLQHDGAVVAAYFSPDGRRVVTASRDKTVRIWDVESGKPVSEPLLHNKEIESASLSADGRWLLTKSAGEWRIWDIAIDLDRPMPLWVPDLAEAVGAKQFNNQGALVDAKKGVAELRRELLALKGDDFWSCFGRWFVTSGPERTISPNSRITVREYIERCIERDSEESLDEAEKLAAGNAELVRRIAAKRSTR